MTFSQGHSHLIGLTKILYLSLSTFPFILWSYIYFCGRFSTPSLYPFWSRSPRKLHQRFRGSTFLLVSSGVLVHYHPSSSVTVPYSFSKSEMGFYGYAVLCVHRHGTSCFKSHPRRLGNVQLIPYPRGLQQNKRWRVNRISAPVWISPPPFFL